MAKSYTSPDDTPLGDPLTWREADLLRGATRSFAHDARSSLGTLRSAAQLLAILLPDRDDLAPYLASMIREVDSLASRLACLEQAASVHSGKSTRVVVAAAVTEVLADVEEELSRRGVAVAAEGDPSVAVAIDASRFQTSLRTLLLHAATLAAPESALDLMWSRRDGHVVVVIDWCPGRGAVSSPSVTQSLLRGDGLPLQLAVAAQAFTGAGGSIGSQRLAEDLERVILTLQEG